ncbi:DsbA family oxidoreductase [Rheinheimera marina]|uniref:DsbA family oxidoreductase n=1 Tax=Rheinheimera marina TaxID=1774958 RepID=A0ABV9JGA6_9GAMM
MRQLHIDLVSDIACPWCAIGYARLLEALHQLEGKVQVSLSWRAFELNPDPDLVPEPILPALARKYGRTEAEMQQSQQQLMEIAKGLGLNFSGMQQRNTSNTFNGHRLVKWAAGFNQQSAMKLALFDAYFGQAEDVNNKAVLLNAVQAAGLDPVQAQAVLDSDAFAAEVRAEEAQYQNAGIQSVPAFIINQQYLISGAREPEVLAQALEQIAAEITDA